MSKIQVGGWSEEEYLLRHDKYSSNMYSNNQGDLPESFSDKDVPHKRTKKMGTPKYLRESCYHRIEYSVTNSLAAFMWRRLLNSATLVAPTHRGPMRVSDRTSTQVMDG